MYDIVTDIVSYPDFLEWCSGSEILKTCVDQGEQIVVARIDISYKGIQQSFTTRNCNIDSSKIIMGLHGSSSQFETMQGEWRFIELGKNQQACKIEFQLDFSVNNMMAMIFQKVFSQIATLQVEGFLKRADQLYV